MHLDNIQFTKKVLIPWKGRRCFTDARIKIICSGLSAENKTRRVLAYRRTDCVLRGGEKVISFTGSGQAVMATVTGS